MRYNFLSKNHLEKLKKEILDNNGIYIEKLIEIIKSKNIFLLIVKISFLIYPIPRLIYRSISRNSISKIKKVNYKQTLESNELGLISINYAGRSGSYVISNIFDGHSQVISLPPSPCFFDGPIDLIKLIERIKFSSFFVFGKRTFFRRWWQSLLLEYISKTFKDLLIFGNNRPKDTDILNESSNPSSKEDKFSLNSNDYEFNTFRENIKKLIEEHKTLPSAKQLLLIVHYAYLETKGLKYDKSKIKYIAWQRHRQTDYFDVKLLHRNFNKLIFITPVRHPVTSLDALIFHNQIFNQSSYELNKYVDNYLESTLHSSSKEVGSQIFLRFEDMHGNNKEVISSLAKILNIEDQACLYETTVNEKPYFFISGKKLITGFNPNIFNQAIKLKSLLSEDIRIIEQRCNSIFKEFNYKELSNNKNKPKNQYYSPKTLDGELNQNKIKIIKKKKNKRILILGNSSYPQP